MRVKLVSEWRQPINQPHITNLLRKKETKILITTVTKIPAMNSNIQRC